MGRREEMATHCSAGATRSLPPAMSSLSSVLGSRRPCSLFVLLTIHRTVCGGKEGTESSTALHWCATTLRSSSRICRRMSSATSPL